MQYSAQGILLTEHFESCKLVSYQDQRGIWTIGYGHTFGVKQGDTCTQAMEEAWLRSDISAAERCVNYLVKVSLTQSEYNALVDFVFNVGSGNFARSTLLKNLNDGKYSDAASEFDKWDYAGGKVSKGLFLRREKERQEFDEQG